MGSNRVTIGSELPAGTKNIGDVDVLSLPAEVGSVTETAPATDTASSGLNGRLQRIAQRLTSLINLLPGFGTAGTPSANVVSVQGVASGSSVIVGGPVAHDGVSTGNPVLQGGYASSATPAVVADADVARQWLSRNGAAMVSAIWGTNGADGLGMLVMPSNDGTNTGPLGSAPHMYSGTNWNRQRSVINAQDSTGIGIAAAGMVGQFDDVSPSTVTENQFAPARINRVRAQYVEPGPYVLGRVTADGQIKASAGFIHTVTIAPLTATPTAGLLTVYDNTAESGTVVYAEWIFATTPGHTVTLDIPAGTGIYVGFDATLANVQATVAYR